MVAESGSSSNDVGIPKPDTGRHLHWHQPDMMMPAVEMMPAEMMMLAETMPVEMMPAEMRTPCQVDVMMSQPTDACRGDDARTTACSTDFRGAGVGDAEGNRRFAGWGFPEVRDAEIANRALQHAALRPVRIHQLTTMRDEEGRHDERWVQVTGIGRPKGRPPTKQEQRDYETQQAIEEIRAATVWLMEEVPRPNEPPPPPPPAPRQSRKGGRKGGRDIR